jgi:phospholipase/carboxylesterase
VRLGRLVARITGGEDGDGGGDGPTVVLMHGFGAPGDDLVPLAREIAAPAGTRFVFPAAPLGMPPPYGAGRAWWAIDFAKLERAILSGAGRDLTRDVPAGLGEARDAVVELLGRLDAEIGAPHGGLVLGGFSQGAMLALDVALRTSTPLAGLVLMSGTLLAEDEWLPRMPARAGLRILQSHGRDDPLLPFAIAERLRDALCEARLAVEWVTFPGGHGIAPNVIERAGAFLSAVVEPY